MDDTICSIATTSGVGAISIIRVSGSDSISIVNKLFKGKNLEQVKSHTINYGFIYSEQELIDEVLVSVMHSPKTYTTEDTVEINCHGGIVTTNKILELLLINGCRLAEPGEFTKRAFLNGRIDLLEAESVMDLIESKSDASRKLALNTLTGNNSSLIKQLRDDLISLISNIEVNIDYPEYEDIYEVTIKDIKDKTVSIKDQLLAIIEGYQDGKIIKNGLSIAIIGRPNVGKSSLLNRILDEEKAIVTNIPGTTRDIVEGSITLNGVLLNFYDTAGIRDTDDVVESIGVKKSLDIIEQSDLVLIVLNNNEALTNYDQELLTRTKDKKRIIIINKDDLENKLELNALNDEHIITTNTLSVGGINSLKDKIKELFNLETITNKDYNYLSSARSIAKVKEALLILDEVINNIDTTDIDLIEMDLKNIWEILGEIIGEAYNEELLDELFSRFCVGK